MSMHRKSDNAGILLADPPTVDGVPDSDPDGRLPAEVLLNGGVARVPRWPIYADAPEKTDLLEVFWRPDGGVAVRIYHDPKVGPITETEFMIPLDKGLFQNDGVAFLYYRVSPQPFGNPLTSEEKRLTIDHSVIPLPILLSPSFTGVDFYGYLNCATKKPIWEGVYVKVPFQNFRENDVCELSWRGFSELTNSEEFYVEGSAGELSHTMSLAEAGNRDGFELPSIPFSPYLEQLIDKCSITARYRVKRDGRYIGQSRDELAKIDRIIPGEDIPCGPV
ncbi:MULTISPECIES: hypothetical protein [unclassified Pseudomonas]|jgi:hypothetical protein|uniref:hypothetical protein n=1 Tax=unclassified Pseudomonas TaxID=196821 RepID=UPI001032ABBA|nr:MULTISPECIES: hypothetical protein [unclassified Pseudomonas]MBR7197931.1 hypothetical protein [Pseudomonas sp. 14A]